MNKSIRHHPRRATEKSAEEIRRDLEFLRRINDRSDKRTKQADSVEKFVANERRIDIAKGFCLIGCGVVTTSSIWAVSKAFPNFALVLFWVAQAILFLLIILAAFHAAKTNEP